MHRISTAWRVQWWSIIPAAEGSVMWDPNGATDAWAVRVRTPDSHLGAHDVLIIAVTHDANDNGREVG